MNFWNKIKIFLEMGCGITRSYWNKKKREKKHEKKRQKNMSVVTSRGQLTPSSRGHLPIRAQGIFRTSQRYSFTVGTSQHTISS